jgi:hypothetical protein
MVVRGGCIEKVTWKEDLWKQNLHDILRKSFPEEAVANERILR